ncbi:hypothetical protein RJI07_03265 [Mycoplasmatota bacterium WC30]
MDINNFDKLVKIVTENILDKLDLKNDSISHEKSHSVRNHKSCIILVPNTGLGVKDSVEYILKNYPGYDIYLGSNVTFSKMDYITNNKNIHFIEFDLKNNEFINLLEGVETTIILGLKISQMQALVETDDSEDINHIILDGLMTNKSIEIIMNVNSAMLNKISATVNNIKNMGIKVVNIQCCDNPVLDKVELITEKYVMNLKQSGLKVLFLNRNQVITPLAKDKLFEYRIKIEYIEEA